MMETEMQVEAAIITNYYLMVLWIPCQCLLVQFGGRHVRAPEAVSQLVTEVAL
jgi:hypothetical protein